MMSHHVQFVTEKSFYSQMFICDPEQNDGIQFITLIQCMRSQTGCQYHRYSGIKSLTFEPLVGCQLEPTPTVSLLGFNF